MAASIQGVYVALFGRPADPTGLAYFNGVTKNGADLTAIGDLASTQEYKDRFAGQNNTQIVNSIYQSLFGRDAEAAGLTFFVNALNTGTLNINNIAIAILDGAQGSDKTIVDTKVAAADLYTSHLDTATEIGSYQGNGAAAQGRAFLAGVTTTVPTEAAVDAAILAMQAAGALGVTITAGAPIGTLDMVTGINDTVSSTTKTTTNNNDTINAIANANDWVVGTSKIDAGLGTDTLNALIDGVGAAVQADGLKNVEILNVSTVTGASTVDVENAAQLTQLWHVANAGAANTNVNLTVTGLAQSATFGLKGDLGASTNNVTFKDSDATSTLNLAFNGAKAGTLTVSDAGTVNLSNTGTTNVPLDIEAKTIVLSGDGSFTLAATDSILQTVNASGFAGTLSADVSGNTTLKTFTGGTGADTVTFSTNHTSDVTISLGAGADNFHIDHNATVSNKAISLSGGDGSDIFYFGTGTTQVGNVSDTTDAASLAKSLITISDFAKGSDSIAFNLGAGTATLTKLTVGQLGQVNAATDLLDAATKAITYVQDGANDVVTTFSFGGSVYIVADSNHSGAFNAGDSLIKVVGITDVADLSSANFTVA